MMQQAFFVGWGHLPRPLFCAMMFLRHAMLLSKSESNDAITCSVRCPNPAYHLADMPSRARRRQRSSERSSRSHRKLLGRENKRWVARGSYANTSGWSSQSRREGIDPVSVKERVSTCENTDMQFAIDSNVQDRLAKSLDLRLEDKAIG